MKDTGKSSSRKLRRVVYYLLYRMDPQKTHYKISFSTKMSKIQNSGFFFYIFPPARVKWESEQQLLSGVTFAPEVVLA